MAWKKKAKKTETPKEEAPKEKKTVKRTTKKSAVKADPIKKRPAVSVDAMVDENKSATVSTDYQKYLRKLMKQVGGKH